MFLGRWETVECYDDTEGANYRHRLGMDSTVYVRSSPMSLPPGMVIIAACCTVLCWVGVACVVGFALANKLTLQLWLALGSSAA